MTVRVLVCDDQAAVREGLLAILSVTDGIRVVGAAADGEECLALARREQPDVVLMDLRMPVRDGVETTRAIRRELPQVQVVVLTTYADDESILSALQAGAMGYLTKDSRSDQIVRAVQAAAAGQAVLEPGVQQRLLAAVRPVAAAPAHDLTARELDVLRLIAGGLSNGEIATRLFVSEATVKTHINHIFAKLDVRDRAQAVTWAYRHGVAAG